MEEKIRFLVRIADTDLAGAKQLHLALTAIKGINFSFSNMLCKIAGIDKSRQVGTLSDAEVSKLNEIIKEPAKFGAPGWMLNRNKDYDSGINMHLIRGDLQFQKENDIKRLRMIKSYKGSRHAAGLPVRGQRTRTNARTRKGPKKTVAGRGRRRGATKK